MWITLAIAFLAVASAEDAVNVAPEVDSVPAVPPGFEGGELPTAQQLLEMLDSMSGISEEEKESLKENLLQSIQDGGGFAQQIPQNERSMQTMILLSLLGVVVLIFGKYFSSYATTRGKLVIGTKR
ncbi:hypothetical protein WH47_08866 [Habropoda laboriosa]|uniref:Uncharacterized protein n=1 Tax=Habropoda laboriosa TaxID=597456 RepID=A0A0L7R6J9_9HYME|nr:hypothetical protein WH47_08866 [Habropoda laboriosa]